MKNLIGKVKKTMQKAIPWIMKVKENNMFRKTITCFKIVLFLYEMCQLISYFYRHINFFI